MTSSAFVFVRTTACNYTEFWNFEFNQKKNWKRLRNCDGTLVKINIELNIEIFLIWNFYKHRLLLFDIYKEKWLRNTNNTKSNKSNNSNKGSNIIFFYAAPGDTQSCTSIVSRKHDRKNYEARCTISELLLVSK